MACKTLTLAKFIAVYALLYGAFGTQSPFLPALLHERGLRADEIGGVLAAATAVRVFAGPAIGQLSDRLRLRTSILCSCSLVAAGAGIGFLVMRGLLPMYAVALIQAAALAPIVPISDALATTAARASERSTAGRFEYGWLRASGSAAFVIGTTLSGWAAGSAGLPIIIICSGILLALGGTAALFLPDMADRYTRFDGPPIPIHSDWTLLFRNVAFRRLLILAAMIEGSHALHDSFAVIRWQEAGVSLAVVGILWSEAVLSEVLVFVAIGPWLVRLLTPSGACAVAAGGGVVRWTVAAFTTSPPLLALIQPLHGLTFALLHLACMRIIVLVVPRRLAATAQSVYGTLCVGATLALLTLISGLLYQHWGGAAFVVMAALCLLALPVCAALARLLPAGPAAA
jgi:MFS transporter, PPP family, 3-phenylpropionic acid transporter